MALPSRLVSVCMIRSSSASTRPEQPPSSSPHLRGGGQALDGVGGRGQQLAGVERRDLHRLGARLDALDVEEVVDQAGQPLAALQRDPDQRVRARGQLAELAAGQQAERAADRGQRGAQLVADDREELVLHPVDLAPLGDVAEDHHRAADARRRRPAGRR